MPSHARTFILLALATLVAAALCALPLASAVDTASHPAADVLADAHGVPATYVLAADPGAPLGATQSSPPSAVALAGLTLAAAACTLQVRHRVSLGRAALFTPLRI